MIVRSKYGDAASLTLFDSSVGPYQVTMQFPETYTGITNLSAMPNAATIYKPGNAIPIASGGTMDVWSGVSTALVQKMLAAAAAKSDQTGPLATAAQQVQAQLQSDIDAVDAQAPAGMNPGPFITPMYMPFLNAILVAQNDISAAGTTLMNAAVEDTGGATSNVTTTMPTSTARQTFAPGTYSNNLSKILGGAVMRGPAAVKLAPISVRMSTPSATTNYDAASAIAPTTDYTPYYAAGGAVALLLGIWWYTK